MSNAESYPWRDRELLKELYWGDMLPTTQIGELLDCSPSTVSTWLDKHSIRRRTRSQAAHNGHGSLYEVPYSTHPRGHEFWQSSYRCEDETVYVHRLVAVSEYGFDAVAGNDVHHKNDIPWDNRPENLELMTHGEHSIHHTKIKGMDRIRIAELYEYGDVSYRKLHEILDYDVSWHTIMGIHKEYYNND